MMINYINKDNNSNYNNDSIFNRELNYTENSSSYIREIPIENEVEPKESQ